MSDFYGLLASSDALDYWYPIQEQETALHAAINNVVFGDNIEQCATKLMQRFPASDPRLTRIHTINFSGYVGNSYRQGPLVYVLPEGEETYDGGDFVTALALAKERRKIRCRELEMETGELTFEAFRKQGFRIIAGYWGAPDVVIAWQKPRASKRKKVQDAKKGKNTPVKCHDIAACVFALRSLVRTCLPTIPHSLVSSTTTRYGVCTNFFDTLSYFSLVFGTGAFRRHPAFRALKKQWRARQKASQQVFKYSNQGQTPSVQIQFSNFMDTELEIRNGPLKDTSKEAWYPRIKFQRFADFLPANYEKFRQRRKRAIAKAAKAAKAAKEAGKRKAAPKTKTKSKQGDARDRTVAGNRAHANGKKVSSVLQKRSGRVLDRQRQGAGSRKVRQSAGTKRKKATAASR